jgi:hypothetical protein
VLLGCSMLPRKELARQLAITLGSRTRGIILDDRKAVAGRFSKPNRTRDDRLKDFFPERIAHARHHFMAQVGARVVHRQHDAFQLQRRVAADALDALDHLENFRESFEREVFALQRNQHGVGRGQRIRHEHAERRRAIDQDELRDRPARAIVLQHAAQTGQAVLIGGELNFASGEIEFGRDDVQALEGRGLDLFGEGVRALLVGEHGKEAPSVRRGEADGAARIRLRIEIDEQDIAARLGQTRGEIYRRRGFTDAAFLIRDRDNFHERQAFPIFIEDILRKIKNVKGSTPQAAINLTPEAIPFSLSMAF